MMQSEIDRLASLSPEMLRAALKVAEKRLAEAARIDAQDEAGKQDESYEDAMKRASAAFLLALREGRSLSTRLRGHWFNADRARVRLEDTQHGRDMLRRAGQLADGKARALANAVSRDPMPCCGVRADLHDKHGCGRRRA